MGYNTTIFVLNDQWHRAQQDPTRFVAEVSNAMYNGGQALGQTTVLPTQHASTFRLYATQHNSVVELSAYALATTEMARRPLGRAVVERMISQARASLDSLEVHLARIPAE